VSNLTHGRIPPHYGAHLDPDLSHGSFPRLAGWRPVFGQTGAAQGHLSKNGVQEGDLFLFFGLFRHTMFADGKCVWLKGSLPIHVLWGWLQVGEVLPIELDKILPPDWAAYHPHFYQGTEQKNVLYISSQYLDLGPAHPEGTCGAGIFPNFSASRQLTAPHAVSPSSWELPEWVFPRNGRRPLTYHTDLGRWRRTEGRVELRSASRGQEFILDCNQYPEALEWISCTLKWPQNLR
jgi:hypothetical protein